MPTELPGLADADPQHLGDLPGRFGLRFVEHAIGKTTN